MGVPAQKYGLESYLGMLLCMAERDKADEMKKINDWKRIFPHMTCGSRMLRRSKNQRRPLIGILKCRSLKWL
jgi:hypothetical protein